MQLKIRKIKKSDLNQYLKLKRESNKEYSKLIGKDINTPEKQLKKDFNECFSKKRFILTAEENKEMIGYITGTMFISIYNNTGYIDDIFVLKEFRKRGVGSSLIINFLSETKKRRGTKCRLGVNPKNKNAFQLYKQLGFKLTHYEMEKKIK